jgi:hypothetical protein
MVSEEGVNDGFRVNGMSYRVGQKLRLEHVIVPAKRSSNLIATVAVDPTIHEK